MIQYSGESRPQPVWALELHIPEDDEPEPGVVLWIRILIGSTWAWAAGIYGSPESGWEIRYAKEVEPVAEITKKVIREVVIENLSQMEGWEWIA